MPAIFIWLLFGQSVPVEEYFSETIVPGLMKKQWTIVCKVHKLHCQDGEARLEKDNDCRGSGRFDLNNFVRSQNGKGSSNVYIYVV